MNQEKALQILNILEKTYPERGPFVQWNNPLELVIGTVLSAQCTDKRVNEVTKVLFKQYRTAEEYADADIHKLEKIIYSTGFYKSKAKYLKGIGKLLVKKYNGKVPEDCTSLITLPGVAKKTAHLVMAKAFDMRTGVAVDTHVKRIAPRLGWTKHTNPDKIAQDLEKLLPKEKYLEANEYLIMHGRAVCLAKPKCPECPVRKLCPSAKKFYPEM